MNDFLKNLFDNAVSTELSIIILVATTIFFSVLALSFFFLEQDSLQDRMKNMVLERNKIRRQVPFVAEKNTGLRQSNDGVIVQLVNQFNLRKILADKKTFANLKMAGYRKQSHIYVFLFFRFILPIILFSISAIYIFSISGMERPFMVKLSIVLVISYAGFYMPNMYISNVIAKRQLSIRHAWSDALDLMLICVESGMSIEAAFNRVSQEIDAQSKPLAEELILTTAELSYLQERRDAYENLGYRTGIDSIRAVCLALIQAEKYGTPIGSALRTLSKENREARMAAAEKKAAALPPKLTVPMIIFFLPVLFAVIMGPAVIQVLAVTG